MKYITSIFSYLLFCLSLSCQADPFYPQDNASHSIDSLTSQAEENMPKNAKQQAEITACLSPQLNRLALPTPFEQLKFIGVVEINQQFRALFVDPQQAIIDLRVDDLLEGDFIQITEITLKSVRYIHWPKSTNCSTPHLVTLKL